MALLEWPENELNSFAQTLVELRHQTQLCSQCFNLTENDKCSICTNPKREQNRIAVVEKVIDLVSIEKTGDYNGLYHVLGGAISPAYGMTPDKLRIKELLNKVGNLQSVSGRDMEIILATNPSTQGETTALYLEGELKSFNVTITRLARGLASGSSLEYADTITLANALKHRK